MSAGNRSPFSDPSTLWKAGLAAVILVGVLVVSFHSVALVKQIDPRGWHSLVDLARSPAGAAIVMGLLIVHGAVPYPVTPLIIASLAAFGPAKGAAIIWSGLMISGYVSYFIARWLEGPILRRFFAEETIERTHRWVNRWGAWGLFLARVLPIPFALGSFAAGLSTLGLVSFGVASGLGLLPGLATEVLASLHSESLAWDVGIFAGTLAVFMVAFAFQTRAERERAREDAGQEPQ